MSRPVLRVLRPGLLSTLQDLGRTGYQRLGVSPCGAMDAFALCLANRLVGNPENCTGLEITLAGAELEVMLDCEVALTGADLAARLDSNPLACWENCFAKAGQRFVFSERRRGARAYLGVAGGFASERVLGSGSTDLRNGWGGLQGRSLRRGDELSVQNAVRTDRCSLWGVRPETLAEYRNPFLLRVLEGPQSQVFSSETRRQFMAAEFRIGANSNRMGYRLEGPRLGAPHREMISDATPMGAIQVLPNGEALLLMADRQTVGGYPKIAVVISADLPKAAQLCPGHRVCFQEVSLPEAHRALVQQEKRLNLELLERS
ncbi:MAG TPA: biotin-dependent carboxyltransferase family protein [Terriglobia bacterium]|nr:biotin-dependent carboxyltransferase family protein [Terriglobia bacterium]